MFKLKKNKTMKKTYIVPAMEIVRIATKQQMLVGSPGLLNEDAGLTGGEYNDSRSIDSFFFDDDEDY